MANDIWIVLDVVNKLLSFQVVIVMIKMEDSVGGQEVAAIWIVCAQM